MYERISYIDEWKEISIVTRYFYLFTPVHEKRNSNENDETNC